MRARLKMDTHMRTKNFVSYAYEKLKKIKSIRMRARPNAWRWIFRSRKNHRVAKYEAVLEFYYFVDQLF